MPMNRRHFLQHAGLLGSASLLLPSLRPAFAAGTPPKRLVLFYSHQGTLPWLWSPKTGGRNDFVLNELLDPLAPYRKDLILLGGVDLKALTLPGGRLGADCHASGQACSMTANVQINDDSKGDPMSRGKGPSFDYWIARKLEAANGNKSPTAATEQRLRIYNTFPTVLNWGRPYEDDKNQWLPPTARPSDVFNRLFGSMTGAAAGPANLRRQAATDFVAAEYRMIGKQLGAYERQRLEQHATLVSELSHRLGSVAVPNSLCTPPTLPPASSGAGATWKLTSDAVPKLLQAAFACDLTRVAVVHVDEPWPETYGGLKPAQLGGIDNLHDLVHTIRIAAKDNQDAARLATVRGFYKSNANVFKSILDKLSETKESDGTRMLDHTAVLWCGELAQPDHSTSNAKWLVAGSCGGALKTGQFLDWDDPNNLKGLRSGRPSNGDVFTTLAHAMGIKENFGASGATVGPIPDMLT